MVTSRSALLIVALLAAPAALAQEPSGPPPPSSKVESAGPDVHELLPDIGRIGAEVGLVAGGSWNPFQTGGGIQLGGFIDLPIGRAAGGKLGYEVFFALSLARSDAFTLGPAARVTRTRLRLLQASPFALKYVLTGGRRLRPYLSAGVDVIVASTREEDQAGSGDEAAALADRGIPTGETSLELGGHAAAGLQVRITSGLSLDLEYRFTAFEGRNARLHTVTSALGIHW